MCTCDDHVTATVCCASCVASVSRTGCQGFSGYDRAFVDIVALSTEKINVNNGRRCININM